jgi:gamma-glutamyl phosphate reductase
MATYSASQSKYATLVANTVDTITLTGSGNTIRFVTTSGSSHAYFTVATPSETPATPTVAGDNTYVTVHASPGYVDIPWYGVGAVIKIISSGTPTVGVMLI